MGDVSEFEITYTRLVIPWGAIEPKRGVFNWNSTSAQRIERSLEKGIIPIPVIRTVGASWATGGNDPSVSFPPLDLENEFSQEYGFSKSYYLFIKAIAEHWQGKFPIIVIENEVTANNFWQGTMNDYLKLLKTAKKAFMDTGQNIRIADSGLASPIWGLLITQQMLKNGEKKEALEFFNAYISEHPGFKQLSSIHELEEFFAETKVIEVLEEAKFLLDKLPKYVDIINFHYYENPLLLPTVINYLRQRTNNMPLMSNEMGIRYWPYTPELNRKASGDLVKKMTFSLFYGLEACIWFPFENPEHNIIGLIKKYSFQKRPIYFTCKVTVSKLNESVEGTKLNFGEDLYAFKFLNNGKPIWVIWSERNDKTIKLNINSSYAIITHIITNEDSTEPEIEILPVSGKLLNLTATQTPVFIEIPKQIRRRR